MTGHWKNTRNSFLLTTMAIDDMSSLSHLSILSGEQTPKKRVFSDLELEEESEEPNKAYDLAKGTLKKRFKKSSTVPTTQKPKVVQLENRPHPKQWTGEEKPRVCVVTHAREGVLPIEFAHILQRRASEEVLTQLEWAWNMDHKTLNTDTRNNIHTLAVHIYKIFDYENAQGWAWIPIDDRVLRAMYKFYVTDARSNGFVRRNPQEFYNDATQFEYGIVPLENMDKCCKAFGRFLQAFDTTTQSSDERWKDFTFSDYPFSDLKATIHVPLHFVIANTGKKLLDLYPSSIFEMVGEGMPAPTVIKLGLMYEIYQAWMRATPEMEDVEGTVSSGDAGAGEDSESGPGKKTKDDNDNNDNENKAKPKKEQRFKTTNVTIAGGGPSGTQENLYVPTLPDEDFFTSDPVGLRPSDSGSNGPPRSDSIFEEQDMEGVDEDGFRDAVGYEYSDAVREWAENVWRIGSTIDEDALPDSIRWSSSDRTLFNDDEDMMPYTAARDSANSGLGLIMKDSHALEAGGANLHGLVAMDVGMN